MPARFLFGAIGLVAVLLTSSCAPTPAAPIVDTAPPASVATETSMPQPTAAAEATDVPTQVVEVQAVATSRGPNLEATDPATVSLASGQLQLVEFFRFT